MSLFYDREEYEPTTSAEIDIILAELPFDLIKESIVEQIEDPVQITTNYMKIILDKCMYYRDMFNENEEILSELNNSISEFCIFVLDLIDKKFNLALDIESLASSKDIVDITESVYKYFILKYQKNIRNFFITYIFNEKKEICKYYSNLPIQKKDVSTLAYKKKIKNPEDLCIIINLPSIIKFIISLDTDPLDFIKLSSDKHNYEASVVKKLIKYGSMIGDFVPSYMELCVDSHDYIIDELHTDIRLKIMKKLQK